jgi:hypothetical protein
VLTDYSNRTENSDTNTAGKTPVDFDCQGARIAAANSRATLFCRN